MATSVSEQTHECCPCGTGYHRGGWVCYGCGLAPWHCNKGDLKATVLCRCLEKDIDVPKKTRSVK